MCSECLWVSGDDDIMNIWEGIVFGLIITLGVLFVANKLKPKKTYWDLHKDAKYNPDNQDPRL